MSATWTLFALSVSVYLKFAVSEDSCSLAYHDVCGSMNSSCVLNTRINIKLKCVVQLDAGHSNIGIQWLTNAGDWNGDGTPVLSVRIQGSEISSEIKISSEGYWWCRVMIENGEMLSCPFRIPVVRIFPCLCDQSLETMQCPMNTEECAGVHTHCQERGSHFCLTNTVIEMQSSLPGTVHVHETETVDSTKTLPYQTITEHAVDSTTQAIVLTPGEDESNSTTTNTSSLLFIVGPVAVVIVISLIVLFLGIGWLHCRMKKNGVGGRRQSHGSGSCEKEEHIYDTINVFVKSSMRIPPDPARNTTPNYFSSAAEYEIPVTNCKCRVVELSNGLQGNCVNPTYLELYGPQNSGQVCESTVEFSSSS